VSAAAEKPAEHRAQPAIPRSTTFRVKADSRSDRGLKSNLRTARRLAHVE